MVHFKEGCHTHLRPFILAYIAPGYIMYIKYHATRGPPALKVKQRFFLVVPARSVQGLKVPNGELGGERPMEPG